jgi:hypothetical protein
VLRAGLLGSNTRLATKLGLYFEVVIRAGFMGRHLRSEGLSDSLLENLEGGFFVCVATGGIMSVVAIYLSK